MTAHSRHTQRERENEDELDVCTYACVRWLVYIARKRKTFDLIELDLRCWIEINLVRVRIF